MIEPPDTVLSAFTGMWMHSRPANTPAWKSAALYPPPDTATATRGGRTPPESGLVRPSGHVEGSELQSRLAARLMTKLSAAVSTIHQTTTNPIAIAVDAPPLIGHRRDWRARVHAAAANAMTTAAAARTAKSNNQL